MKWMMNPTEDCFSWELLRLPASDCQMQPTACQHGFMQETQGLSQIQSKEKLCLLDEAQPLGIFGLQTGSKNSKDTHKCMSTRMMEKQEDCTLLPLLPVREPPADCQNTHHTIGRGRGKKICYPSRRAFVELEEMESWRRFDFIIAADAPDVRAISQMGMHCPMSSCASVRHLAMGIQENPESVRVQGE